MTVFRLAGRCRGVPQAPDGSPQVAGTGSRRSAGVGEGGDPLPGPGCTLTRADEPTCQSYARITITDSEGATAGGCPRPALDGITGAHVDRADSKGLNKWERKALELSEERNKLSALR